MERAFRAIRRSDVVALVIDAVDGITQQDFRCRPGRCLHHRCAICRRPLRSALQCLPMVHRLDFTFVVL